jgi:hypothetical protein
LSAKDTRWSWAIAVLLFACWLGARSLDADALWYDEFLAIYNAGGAHHGPLPPAEILRRLTEYNPWQGAGYPLVLAGWGALAGWTAFAGRTFSLLTGLLAITWTYRAGRDMASPRVGFSAAITLGVSAFFIDYLHELRAYTLYALFTAMTLATYWRMITRPSGWGTRALFLIGMVGLFYTHYFAALAVVGIALYHLLFVRKTRQWWTVVGIMAVAGLIFLPWFSVMLSAVGLAGEDAARQTRAMDALEILQSLPYAFSNGIVVLLVIFAGAATLARSRAVGLVAFVALCILVFALILNTAIPVITHVRYLMALWPVLALLVGLGIDQLACYRIPPALVLAIWVAAGLWNTFNPAFIDGLFRDVHLQLFQPHLPVHTMTRVVATNVQTDDGVAFDVPVNAWAWAGAFDYYMHPLPVSYSMLDWLTTSSQEGVFYGLAREYLADKARVWLGVAHNAPPDTRLGEFERALADDDFSACGNYLDLPDLRLDLYSRGETCCLPSDAAPLIRYGDGIHLTSVEIEQRDDNLRVLAAWSLAPEVPRSTYSVALHVVDNTDTLVAQADYGLPPDAFACRVSNIALTELPPGDYILMGIVYNWSSGERLPATNLETGAQGERLPLAEFAIP